MPLTEKQRKEIMLRIIDLCKTVDQRGIDPFEVDVYELFQRLRKILPKISDWDEFYLDIEAVLGLSGVVFQQGEWVKHRSSLLYFDPLLVMWKINALSSRELAEILARSWHPIVGMECLTPAGIREAMEYWTNLPSLAERGAKLDAVETLTGELALRELAKLGLVVEEGFTETLEKFWRELKRAAGEKGEISYWDFVRARTFEETVGKAWLVSFLVSYGYATLEVKPLEDEIILRPLAHPLELAPREMVASVPISLSRGEWRRRAKVG
jgi:hypothetical protein